MEKTNMICNIIQTGTGILGLTTIIVLCLQIKSESKWKKLNLVIDKINPSLLKTNGKIISDFGINMNELTVCDDDFRKLTDKKNIVILNRVQEILDMFENFATLYNMKLFNNYYVYEIYSETIIYYYTKFERIIEYLRKEHDDFYYQNFVKCANILLKQRSRKNAWHYRLRILLSRNWRHYTL